MYALAIIIFASGSALLLALGLLVAYLSTHHK
jgi:hypothetical protein